MLTGFDRIWKESSRYRRPSRELEPLVRSAYDAIVCGAEADLVRERLERLLGYLASEDGRTDANCCVTDAFFSADSDLAWEYLPKALQDILGDMGGALHDTIYAPHIASNFESLPEQLLERVRRAIVISEPRQ